MTRQKHQTTRRNTHPSVTSPHELRTEDYDDDVRNLELRRHCRKESTVRHMTFTASQNS